MKCCAKAGKECQTADTARKDEATQRTVNPFPNSNHESIRLIPSCSLVTGFIGNINEEMTGIHKY